MNDKTLSILQATVAKIDCNIMLTRTELQVVSETLKYLMPLALDPDGNYYYRTSQELEADYGIR